MSEVDILAIFAHPDDLELTVGGTLLKMKSLGYRTGGLDITRGEMGTRGTPEGRAEEAAEAARILKLDVRENLGLPDGHVFADDESRTKLVRVLRRLKPKIILTHQIGDPHPDHGKGPPPGTGRPDAKGRPVPKHGSSTSQMPTTNS